MSGLDIPLEGKAIRQLCGTVCVMEAVVIGLAILLADRSGARQPRPGRRLGGARPSARG